MLMELRLPELRDPEYGYKLMRLRPYTQQPRSPLTVILGSSRAALGFRPDILVLSRLVRQESDPDKICQDQISERLSEKGSDPFVLQHNGQSAHVRAGGLTPFRTASDSPNGQTPRAFNFALTGAGPIMELLCLRRLLGKGIRPERVILEILPPLLHQTDSWSEEAWLNIDRLGFEDVRFLGHYTDQPLLLWMRWIRSRSVPWFTNRFCIMSDFAPGWLPWECRQDGWRGMDDAGWLPYPRTAVDSEEYERGREFARKQYAPAFQDFEISAKPEQALRELLELCRRRQIAVVLVLMPEGSDFQSWYPPRARTKVNAYLAEVTREYGVPLIDARSWMNDSAFFDGHHLLPDGARLFTERFARDVSWPF
jgi:hypothetical protein